LGLLPTAIAITKKENSVRIGIGSPALLSGVSQNPAILELAKQIEKKLKEIIHKAAGVEALKPTAITLYSTTTCPYCKMEASSLDSKHIPYTEVKVDIDQKAGEEMVKKTGQMGVPVTEIRYDNGEEEYVVGFDQQKLQTIIGGMI
jgi:glutaredoxin 3